MPTTLKRANVKVKVNGQFQDLGLLQSDVATQLADEIATRQSNDNSLEANKIPYPQNPDSKYGNPGDILRTDGAGGTKWVPVGQPTDEQTQNAINNWLDEHPEATTTVEDHSLTYEKLVNGTLGFVTPEMFGAKGDGTTVDNNALNACLTFCMQNKVPCYGMTGKTYIVDDSTNTVPGTNNKMHSGVMVNGGMAINGCHFKLKSGCKDGTTLLTCVFNGDPYLIENCIFEGEIRTLDGGFGEDGGNHGIIFCDGISMFPTDWQLNSGNVTIRNCKFINIQAYGIFHTPQNNKLIIENCIFECHGPGILPYSSESIIKNCEYKYVSAQSTTIHALAIDEIESFSNASTVIKKNIILNGCKSDAKIYQLAQKAQTGALYDNIILENCYGAIRLIETFYGRDPAIFCINANAIKIKNCISDGAGSDEPIILRNIKCDNVLLDDVVPNKKLRITMQGKLYIINCKINKPIFLYASDLTILKCQNCKFTTTATDGFITTSGSTIATCGSIFFNNIITEVPSKLIHCIDADNIYVNGIIGDGAYITLLYNTTPTDTNIYVDGLIEPVSDSPNGYFVNGITGNCIIRGMSKGTRTRNVSGTTTKELTLIP